MLNNIKKFRFRSNDLWEYHYRANTNTQPFSAGGTRLFFTNKSTETGSGVEVRAKFLFDSQADNGKLLDLSPYHNDLILNTTATQYETFNIVDKNVKKYYLAYYPKNTIIVKHNNVNTTNYRINGNELTILNNIEIGDYLNVSYEYTKAYQDNFYFLNFITDGWAVINESPTLNSAEQFTVSTTIKLNPDLTDNPYNYCIYSKGDVGAYQYLLKVEDARFVFRTTVDGNEIVLTSDYVINKYLEQVISIIVTYKKLADTTAEFKMYIFDSFSEENKISSQKDGLNKSLKLAASEHNFITPNGRNLYLGQDFTNNLNHGVFTYGAIILFDIRSVALDGADIVGKFQISDCYVQNKFEFKPLGSDYEFTKVLFSNYKSCSFRISQNATDWFYIDNKQLLPSTTQYSNMDQVNQIEESVIRNFNPLYFELKMTKFISWIKEIDINVSGVKYAKSFPVVTSVPSSFFRKKSVISFNESIEFRRGYVFVKIIANHIGKPRNINNASVTIWKNFTEQYSYADFSIYKDTAEIVKEIDYKVGDYFLAEVSIECDGEYNSKKKLIFCNDTLDSLNFIQNAKIKSIDVNIENIEYDLNQKDLKIADQLQYTISSGNVENIKISRIISET